MPTSQRQSAGRPPRTVDAFAQARAPHVRSNIRSGAPSGHAALSPSGHAAGGDSPTWPPVPLCFHQEISRMTKFECILDQPISSAWPVASDWLETFLHDGGNRWDDRIASVMTADAVTAALAHSTRPVRLVGATAGATAQISLQAHSTGQPQEWTALSPIVEDALPRLRRHTRHCGAAVHLSMAGAETSLWFRLPRPATGIRRLRRQPSASATSSLIPGRRLGSPANAPAAPTLRT